MLVTWTGVTGPSASVAERVSRVFSGLGEDVTLLPMSRVKSLRGYETVVAGSIEQSGHWLPEAMDFVKKYQATLKSKQFAIFTVCPTLAGRKGAESHMVVMQYTAPVRALVHPVSEGFFTGTADQSERSGPGERSRFKLSILLGIIKESGYRNQAAIEAWAATVHDKLPRGTKRGSHSQSKEYGLPE